MKPFTFKNLTTPSFTQSIFKTKPKENAVISINNLLARVEKPSQLTFEDLNKIAIEYKINISKDFKEELKNFYKEYLIYCFEDKRIDENESENLTSLKSVFDLNDSDINNVHEEVAKIIYGESVDDAIADGQLTIQEIEFLKKLRSELRITNDLAETIYKSKTEKYLENYMSSIVSNDDKLSSLELDQLNKIAKSLGLNINLSKQSKLWYEKYKLFWLIDNGIMNEIDVAIKLKNNEKCYFMRKNIELYEHKKSKGSKEDIPVAKIRVSKGVLWELHNLTHHDTSDEILTLIDIGNVYLTNQRITFEGNFKNTTLELDEIENFTPFSNGVHINRTNGKNLFLMMKEDADVFSMMLDKLMKL